MNLFFVPDITGSSIELNIEESRHCIKVLRLKKGDPVSLINGKGSIFEAVILLPDPKGCILEITKEIKAAPHRNYQITIAIAPTKNMDRFEWFLEKSTEIGIDRIIPLICRHSERKDVKPDRLVKILVSAIKQSGQLYLPELSSPVTFQALMDQYFDGGKMIAHCDSGEKKSLVQAIHPGENLMILIGPEGDFDPSEIKMACEKGYLPVSLGESRLRTETAGVVACHTACLVNSR